MSLTLHLIRHGRTEYNEAKRMQGWCDSPLTPGGLEGVRETAEMLKGIPFSAAWSSPSGRTMATASEILRFHPHVPLHLDEDLRELSFGVHERQLESEVFAHKNLEKTFFDVLHSDTLSFTGGETGLAFRTRVLSVFERIVGANLQGNVLVVSHGVTLSTLLTLIDRSRPIEPLANASVSTIQISNGAYTIGSIGALPSSSAAS